MFSRVSDAFATPCLIASSNPFSELAVTSMVFAMLMMSSFRLNKLACIDSDYQLAGGIQLHPEINSSLFHRGTQLDRLARHREHAVAALVQRRRFFDGLVDPRLHHLEDEEVVAVHQPRVGHPAFKA